MKISVAGTGYVGLVTGVCLAEKGHDVTCVDIDRQKVEMINECRPPIHEKGLEELLNRNVGPLFRATTDLVKAVMQSDLTMIAVGTPFDGELIDLTYIRKVSRQIGSILKKKKSYHVVVVKSTVVPGTTDDVVIPLLEEESGKKAGVDFGVGMNPEFLREGEAVSDFMNPDRIVLGGIDKKTNDVLDDLYRVFDNADIVKTNNKTAEMIKYTANSLLATLISFSNEIGNLCAEIQNVDVVDVMKGVLLDKRFSPILPNGERVRPGYLTYLAAGCGFGGSCFPKDVKALIAHGKERNNPMHILDAVIKTNENQPGKIISILEKKFKNLENRKIALLGLAFKPGTDDMRESPSIPIVEYLKSRKANVRAYDPVATSEAKKLFGNSSVAYHDNLAEILSDSEIVILITAWKEFEKLPELLRPLTNQPLLIDGRRMIDKASVKNYYGIGLNLT